MSEPFHFPAVKRNQSQLTLEQRLEEAYRQGVAEGRSDGEASGRQQALQQLRAELEQQYEQRLRQQQSTLEAQNEQRLAQLVTAVKQSLTLEESQLSEDLFVLIQGLAQAVIDAELSQQPDVYLAAIRRVLECLQGRDHIGSISVSNSDGEWLQTHGIQQINGIDLRIDESLPAGQVQFDGDVRLHQLSFHQRLDEALQQIRPMLTDAAD